MAKETDTVTLWHRHSKGEELTRDQYVQLLIDPRVGEAGTNEVAAKIAELVAAEQGRDDEYEVITTAVEVCWGHPGSEPLANCNFFPIGPALFVQGRVWKVNPSPEASIRAALV